MEKNNVKIVSNKKKKINYSKVPGLLPIKLTLKNSLQIFDEKKDKFNSISSNVPKTLSKIANLLKYKKVYRKKNCDNQYIVRKKENKIHLYNLSLYKQKLQSNRRNTGLIKKEYTDLVTLAWSLILLKKSISNCSAPVFLRKIRRGRSNILYPSAISEKRINRGSFKFLIEESKKRRKLTKEKFSSALAHEICRSFNFGTFGEGMKRKEEIYKLAVKNRANLRFRIK